MMNNLSKQLATICLDDLSSQEQSDPLAIGMGLLKAELHEHISSARPIALQQAENKWLSALWVTSPSDSVTGELVYVAKECSTEKMALITANYYRLHCLINKSNTDFYTSQP
ncbi:MAG: hypothetical protein ACRBG0_07300 [Lewinella sp.]|jgi:hypothetical protein|uniref:hypothetical protein n=1 Tax=Lewinella sp. TaxID=2004506 RepID=UPI003D6A73BE